MTLMRVKGLVQNRKSPDATLILEDVSGRLALAFFVPMNEAGRLIRVLGLTGCRCAPVYDLVVELAAAVGLWVARAVIDYENEGIYATLVVERQSRTTGLRCHPADAIALALRTQSPIYATAVALDHACPLGEAHRHTPEQGRRHEETPAKSPSDLAQWLDGVRPDDFRPAERQ